MRKRVLLNLLIFKVFWLFGISRCAILLRKQEVTASQRETKGAFMPLRQAMFRKYRCGDCGAIVMCECERELVLDFLPHQVEFANAYGTRKRVPVDALVSGKI